VVDPLAQPAVAATNATQAIREARADPRIRGPDRQRATAKRLGSFPGAKLGDAGYRRLR